MCKQMSGAEKQENAKPEVEFDGITGVFMSLFKPGVTVGMLNFTRVVIFTMMCFFFLWPLVDYNIHYIIMGFLSLGFFLSFEFFSYHLKKNPDIMNPHAATKAD